MRAILTAGVVALALAAFFAPRPAEATCVISGTTVTCIGTDPDGVTTGNNFTVSVNPGAFVQSIFDGNIPSSCAEFVSAIRTGNGTRITNQGLILGRSNCGVGVEAGDALTLTNDGAISTDQDVGYAIISGNGSTIQNTGQINTVGNEATVIIVGNDSRLTNTATGRIGTTGPLTTTLIGGDNVTVVTEGRMGAAGSGGTVIDLGARANVSNGGVITANGSTAVGVRLRGDNGTLTNWGTIVAQPAITPRPGETSIGLSIEAFNATIVNETGATISGATAGISVGGSATITNRGTIQSASAPVRIASGANATINNFGRIEGALDINAASRLTGNGTIVGNLLGSGTVAPGPGIAAMTVAGSFNLAGGRLEVDVSGDGTSDRILLAGPTLSLGGVISVNFTGQPVRNGQTFPFIIPTGATPLAMTRIQPGVADNSPVFLNAQVAGVNVVVSRAPYASIAGTPAQQSVAQALDAALPSATSATAPLFLALDLSTADQARATFDQLTPPATASLTLSPLNGLRTLTDAAADALTLTESGASGWGAWGAVARHSGARSKGLTDRYRSNATVAAAGLEFAVSDDISAGVMLGRSSGEADLGRSGAAGTQDDEAVIASATAKGRLGPVDAALGVGFGDGEIETERRHSIGGVDATVAGEADSNLTIGFARISRRFDAGTMTLTPSAGFDYGRVRVATLAEAGPFGLSLDDHAHSSARSHVRLAMETALGSNRPRATVGWSHQFADGARSVTARIPGSGIGSFTIAGIREKRDVIEGDVAVLMDLAPGAVLSIGFGGGINDRLYGQAIHAGVSVAW